MAYSYSTPQKSEQGEMPLHSLGPIPPLFLMGWDRGWVMAFPLVSSLF